MKCIEPGCSKSAEEFSNYCKEHKSGIIPETKPTETSIKRD
jgi:hypothetical protein